MWFRAYFFFLLFLSSVDAVSAYFTLLKMSVTILFQNLGLSINGELVNIWTEVCRRLIEASYR
jgi:hypothetical protein